MDSTSIYTTIDVVHFFSHHQLRPKRHQLDVVPSVNKVLSSHLNSPHGRYPVGHGTRGTLEWVLNQK